MMYDPAFVQPMREELTRLGVTELTTPEAVDATLKDAPGTVLVVVNSICGCSAGGARPAVAMALQHQKLPNQVVTVFAGQDKEATDRARSYFQGYPPSSPSIGLLKDGKLVHMIERSDIEGRPPADIAYDLVSAFERHC
jgi:putative YphP/YqiW family bacilliredoxin